MPLTGNPSHDIPILKKEGKPQEQAVAIALNVQRGDATEVYTYVVKLRDRKSLGWRYMDVQLAGNGEQIKEAMQKAAGETGLEAVSATRRYRKPDSEWRSDSMSALDNIAFSLAAAQTAARRLLARADSARQDAAPPGFIEIKTGGEGKETTYKISAPPEPDARKRWEEGVAKRKREGKGVAVGDAVDPFAAMTVYSSAEDLQRMIRQATHLKGNTDDANLREYYEEGIAAAVDMLRTVARKDATEFYVGDVVKLRGGKEVRITRVETESWSGDKLYYVTGGLGPYKADSLFIVMRANR